MKTFLLMLKFFAKSVSSGIFKQCLYYLNQGITIEFTSRMKWGSQGGILECAGAGRGMKLNLLVKDGGLHF